MANEKQQFLQLKKLLLLKKNGKITLEGKDWSILILSNAFPEFDPWKVDYKYIFFLTVSPHATSPSENPISWGYN